VAKGVRLIKSRSGGHLELFGEVSLMLAEGRNLAVVTSARLLWYPHHLAGDYEGLELAFMMATMIDRLIHEGQPNQRAYTTLREALGALEASE
ncbi:DNA repair protein RecO, partial [Streptococcus suis]